MASTVEMIAPETATEPQAANPFLTGIHAPMTEELVIEDLVVTGSIPAALDGRYLRIGPNPAGPVDPATHHWFTGDGMVHGLRLEGEAPVLVDADIAVYPPGEDGVSEHLSVDGGPPPVRKRLGVAIATFIDEPLEKRDIRWHGRAIVF